MPLSLKITVAEIFKRISYKNNYIWRFFLLIIKIGNSGIVEHIFPEKRSHDL